MSQTQLDEKIQSFLSRKETEHPELKESVEELYHDLARQHLASRFHAPLKQKIERPHLRNLSRSRLGGLHYAV